ncbi:MAG: molybdenum cofactor synthesis domain-containing protein [Bacteroidota bacterium]
MHQPKKLKVISVNISEKKGTIKHPVDKIEIDHKGIINDAHAGAWHRQVSLLEKESIDRFSKEAGRTINYGEFAENITASGLEHINVTVFDRLKIGGVELEVTQIGKKCHGNACAIFREVGKCVMPKEGIFCRVITTGTIKPGDMINHQPKILKILVITLSDRASKGEYEDKSGPKIIELTGNYFKTTDMKCHIDSEIIPDDASILKSVLQKAKKEHIDFIFTTGGTGIGPRDITPDVVRPMLDKEIPGIMEMIRYKFGQEKPNALLSRGVAGIMGETLVYTLPGSVRAVEEYTGEIFKTLQHLIYMQHGLDIH